MDIRLAIGIGIASLVIPFLFFWFVFTAVFISSFLWILLIGGIVWYWTKQVMTLPSNSVVPQSPSEKRRRRNLDSVINEILAKGMKVLI